MAKGQRDSRREGFWRRTLAQFSTSGLSVRDFCRQAKVTEASFYAWRRTIQQRDAEQAGRSVRQRASKPTFVPLVVLDKQLGNTRADTITIELGCGSQTRVLRLPATTATDRIADLIRAVEAIPAPAERCS
jgi:transposase-like protein